MAITNEDIQLVLKAIKKAQNLTNNTYRFLRLRYEDGRERDYLCSRDFHVPEDRIVELLGKKGTVVKDFEQDISKTGIAIGLYRWLD